jgi:hypothetical protein
MTRNVHMQIEDGRLRRLIVLGLTATLSLAGCEKP